MSVFVEIEKTLGRFHLQAQFEAEDETLALLGASGCGKSVTLKCIAGILRPDKGRILVDGETYFDSHRGIDLPPQRRRVGLMFQNYALFPHMTVEQNLRCGAMRESGRDAKNQSVAQVLEALHLTGQAKKYPHQLSGGEQQRVALGRILVSRPNILLLDEPFSALDSHLRFRLEQEVRAAIRELGKTALLVSHDRDEVFRMADRIAIMHEGAIEAIGPKGEVFSHPVTRAGAILTGCKNVSRLEGDFAADWGVRLQLPNPSPDITCVGIRMKHIRPGEGPNTLRCHVAEEIENPFSYTILLRPVGTDAPTPLGWELPKDQWAALRGPEVTVHLPEESILLLKEGAYHADQS